MKKKSYYIAAGIFFAIISIIIYFTFRLASIERGYTSSLVRTTNSIIKLYQSLEKKKGIDKISSDDLNEFLHYIMKKNRKVALLAVTDDSLTLRLSQKNTAFVQTDELSEKILKDFIQGRFDVNRDNPFIVRYYDEIVDKEVRDRKFYIFINILGNYRLLTVFPYSLDRKTVVRITMELALIVVVIILATLLVYMVKVRGDFFPHVRSFSSARSGVELNLNQRTLQKEDMVIARDTASIVSDSLRSYVYNLFRNIAAQYRPDSVSLYIVQTGSLVKAFELKGESFIKIQSGSFDTIDINNETGQELRQSSSMILEGGRRVLIPLSYNESFLGTVLLTRSHGFSGTEVNNIRTAVEGTVKNLNDFIMVDNVMVDQETGLYSKTFFRLKYNESLKLLYSEKRDFSVVLVSLFDDGSGLSREEKNRVIKLVSSSIVERMGENDYLSHYDDSLSLLLNNTGYHKALSATEKIVDSLRKYKIKIDSDRQVALLPRAGLASTDRIDNQENLLKIAEKNLAIVHKRGKGNISAITVFEG